MPPNGPTVRDRVKAMIAMQGWTLTDVAKEISERHPDRGRMSVQSFSNKLTRGTIQYAEVLEIAEIIGLEPIWIRSDSHPRTKIKPAPDSKTDK